MCMSKARQAESKSQKDSWPGAPSAQLRRSHASPTSNYKSRLGLVPLLPQQQAWLVPLRLRSDEGQGWIMVIPMILPQVMQLLPQACCLPLLNQQEYDEENSIIDLQ
ncbi:hypothetical protein EJB05_48964, partial [Eragrostis curvula]